jgi:hypothetical protein
LVGTGAGALAPVAPPPLPAGAEDDAGLHTPFIGRDPSAHSGEHCPVTPSTSSSLSQSSSVSGRACVCCGDGGATDWTFTLYADFRNCRTIRSLTHAYPWSPQSVPHELWMRNCLDPSGIPR